MEEVINDSTAEDEEGVEGDNETPVTEPETTPAEEPAATPEEEAVEIPEETPEVTPEETPEVTPEEDSEEAPKEIGGPSNTIDAAEVTEASVTVITLVDKEEESDDGKTKTVLGVSDASDADVTFTNGCVNDGKLVTGKDLTFKIQPGEGRVLLRWGYILSDAKSQEPKESDLKNTAMEGSIPNATLVPKTGSAKSVTIFVKTEPASYKVTFVDAESEPAAAFDEAVLKIYQVEDDKLKTDTVTATSGITIKQGESEDFALEMVGNKILDSIKLNGKTVEFEETEEYAMVGAEADAAKITAYPFTINPSEYGLDGDKANEAATVQIKVRDAYKLSVTPLSVVGKNAALKAHTGESSENTKLVSANASDGTFAATGLTEGSADYEKTKLAFAVQPDNDYKIKSVSAKVKKTDDAADAGETVDVDESEEKDGAAGEEKIHEYTIDLSQDALALNADKTLTITIETEVDDDEENTNVHRITFAAWDDSSDLNNVTIEGTPKNGSAKEIKNAAAETVRILEDDYTVKVTAKPGYALVKGTDGEGGNLEEDEVAKLKDKAFIVIEETRKYEGKEGTFSVARKAEMGDEGVKIDFTKNTTGDTKYEDGATDLVAYTVLSAVVKVGVSIEKNDDEKLIAFDNQIKDAVVAITNTAGVYKDQYPESAYTSLKDETYTVAESVDLLTFTVTSAAVKPVVELYKDSTKIETLDGVTTEGSGVYAYSVPAQILSKNTAEVNKIVIGKELGAAKDVTITVDKSANIASLLAMIDTVKQEDEELEDGKNVLDSKPQVGQTIKLVFTAKKNVTFGEITAKMGETPLTAVIGTDETTKNATATIETIVTDAITVDVKTVAPYYVVLGGAVTSADGVYSADYDAKNITVHLMSADTSVDEEFYDIAVKDGGATAVTTAKLDSDKMSATIAKIEPAEWGKTLTIEVQRTKDKNEKYTATLVVNASSDEVTVTNVATNTVVPEEGITVMRDDSFKLRVTPKAGASKNDLKLMFCDETGKSDTKAAALFEGDLELNGNNEIELWSKAAAAAYDGDVYLGIFNSRNGADGKPQTAPLKGGLIKIKVADPVVLSADIAEVKVTSGDSSSKDSNKSIGVNMNIGLASKNARIKKPLTNDLYYKVEVTGITGSVTEGELKTVDNITEYLKIDKALSDGEYYDASAFAMYQEYNLVKSYKPAGAKNEIVCGDGSDFRNLNIPGTISATVKVTLVQGVTGSELTSSSAAKDYAVGKDASASLATKLPIYETKLNVTKMNNATVFSGQRAVVAVPKFTQTTSKNNVQVNLINTKTGKILANQNTSWQGISAGVYDDGSIWVNATTGVYPKYLQTYYKDDFNNLAVKITASVPVTKDDENNMYYSGYAATAVLKIKVQQGIYSIAADQSKTALTTKLYQAPNGTVKSVKVTPLFNGGSKDYKPAKAAVTWAITDSDGEGIESLDPHMQDAVTGKKPLITVKNGTISVNKNYKRAWTKTNQDADTFYVTATAADFTTGDQRETYEKIGKWEFTVSGENQTIGKLVVVNEVRTRNDDEDGSYSYSYSYKPVDEASLKAEDFKSGNLYVAAVKSGAEPDKVSGEYSYADFIPVTIKAAGKLIELQGNGATMRQIKFLKPGTTKITATTVDGGKGAGTTATLNLTVAAYAQMGLELTSADGVTTDADVTAIDYYGGSNMCYTMKLRYYDAADKKWKYESNYKNVKAAIKGGKLYPVKNWAKTGGYEMGTAVVVTDKNGTATITLTDTATKKTLAAYTITNKSNSSVKAPSVKLAKIVDVYGKVQKKVDRNTATLTFQVTTSDKKLENYAGKYIKLTPDFTVDSSKNAAYNWLRNGSYGYGKIEKIDENGQFTRSLDDVRGNYTYKMVATVGDIKDGEFVAEAKDAKVSFSVSNKKYSNDLKIGAKYVLDAQGGSKAPITVTTGYGYWVSNAMNVIKKDKDQTANDHMNNFTTYFMVYDNEGLLYNKDNYDGYYEASAKIGLRNDLTAEQIKYITGQDPATAKAAKADCEGYITVWNSNYRKDVKITVSFKGVNFTATADPVYASSKSVKVPVKIMNGKQEVLISDMVLDGTSTVVENDKAIKVDEESGKAVINTVKDLKAGSYEINLRVLPLDSAYNKDTKDKADDKKAIDKVTLTYGMPVTLKLEVKDLADAKMIDVGKNLKYTLSSLAYSGYDDGDRYVTGNGYQIAAKRGESGYYQVDVPFTLAASNATVYKNTNKDTYVKVDLDESLIKPDSKKPALVQAEVVYMNDNKGVLQIRVAKQFIETCDKMERKDKPLTGWNKKLVVPVSVQPSNTAEDKGAAQTVTFTLTTPKAPLTFAQVQEKIKAAGLEKIQAVKSTYATEILYSLYYKVYAKLQTIVPADADVDVTVNTAKGVKPENKPASTAENDILAEGKAVITIEVTDWSKTEGDPATIDLTYNLALDQSASDGITNVTAIANAINAKSDWKFTNETTEKDLIDEVYKIKAVETILMKQDEDADTYSKKGRKDNISMKVVSFTKVTATTKTGSMTSDGKGSITATISIIDLVSGDRATAKITKEIITLTNIVQAYNEIREKIDDVKAKEIFKNCLGDKDLIAAELEKEAKKVVADITATSSNADVKVEVPADSVVAEKPKKATDAVGTEGEDGYVPAEDEKPGTLSFKIVLTEGTRVKNYNLSVEIEASEATSYLDLDEATELAETAVKGVKGDKTEEVWAKTIAEALKTAIATETVKEDFAAKTDAKKNAAIKDVIEKFLNEGSGVLTTIYGYEAVASVSEYTAATKKNDEVVSFTVNVKTKVGDTSGDAIAVDGAVLSEAVATKMSVEELVEELDNVTAVPVTGGGAYTDADGKTARKTAIKTEVKTYIEALVDGSAQEGELKGAAITADVETADFTDTPGEDGAGTITAITGVKVTVKKDSTIVIPEKAYDYNITTKS